MELLRKEKEMIIDWAKNKDIDQLIKVIQEYFGCDAFCSGCVSCGCDDPDACIKTFKKKAEKRIKDQYRRSK